MAPPAPAATPLAKKLARNQLRAISTPNRNESVSLGRNVTFLEKSGDLSAIPILSPPSETRKKRGSSKGRPQEEHVRVYPEKRRANDVSSCSFRFRRGKKDNFDDLLDAGSPSSKKATGKAATPKAAEDTPSKGRKKK